MLKSLFNKRLLLRSKSSTGVFLRILCNFFKNTDFAKHLQTAAPASIEIQSTLKGENFRESVDSRNLADSAGIYFWE